MSIKFFFLVSLFITLAQAAESNKITQIDALRENYFTKIQPHFAASKLKFFTTKDDLKIAYKVFKVKNEKATVLISSGRTEGLVKYEELIYDLNRNGYSVYIHDHRGQGFSSRMTPDLQLGYVKDFSDYVKDMKQFVDTLVKYDKKLFLLAHSMGGAIASLYIEKYPYDFDAVVLSSPMHQADLLGDSATNLACRVIEKRVPKTPRYILGEKPFDLISNLYSDNLLTHSRMRFDISKIVYEFNPTTKIGGPSVNWVAEACKISPIIIYNAKNIKIPVLLIQAGGDKIVNLEPQREFCHNAGKYCKLLKIDDAYHELFIEKDIYRNKALGAMFTFFNENL